MTNSVPVGNQRVVVFIAQKRKRSPRATSSPAVKRQLRHLLLPVEDTFRPTEPVDIILN
jgi:hypothetical protein